MAHINGHLHPCTTKEFFFDFFEKIPFKVHKFLLPVAHTDYRRSHMRLQLKNITRKLVVYRHVLVMDSNSFISHSFMCGIKIAIISLPTRPTLRVEN
jgi:hypothetical protein